MTAWMRPTSFLATLPKAELHLHLEGSIAPSTLHDLQLGHGVKTTLAEVEKLYEYDDFVGFLMSFKAITEHLQTPDDYELITYRLMERLRAENVLHAEVYVSVGVCLWRKQDFARSLRHWNAAASGASAILACRCCGSSMQFVTSGRSARKASPSWRCTIRIEM